MAGALAYDVTQGLVGTWLPVRGLGGSLWGPFCRCPASGALMGPRCWCTRGSCNPARSSEPSGSSRVPACTWAGYTLQVTAASLSQVSDVDVRRLWNGGHGDATSHWAAMPKCRSWCRGNVSCSEGQRGAVCPPCAEAEWGPGGRPTRPRRTEAVAARDGDEHEHQTSRVLRGGPASGRDHPAPTCTAPPPKGSGWVIRWRILQGSRLARASPHKCHDLGQ